MNRTRSQPTETFTSERDGFAAYGLRSEAVELVVIPNLGANLFSLRSIQTGREWMWRRPNSMGLFANALGDAFERSPLAGAVECIPTIAACTVSSLELPDHGEAWTAAWQLDESAFRDMAILTRLRLPVSGLEFSRSIRLECATARFEYRLVNPTFREVSYLWAFHPLLAVETGDRLQLPNTIRCVYAGASQGYSVLASAAVWSWPQPMPGVRLDLVGSARHPNTFAKLFADFSACRNGWAALCRGADRLEFRFNPKEVPYLGLWLTEGGWHGFTHVAIEPASNMTDSLADACPNPLAPAAERYWQFEIDISTIE